MFKDLFSLQGRVALVTGGSRGIGRMIAAGFLAQGAARVYITARKASPCETTARELSAQYGGECIALPRVSLNGNYQDTRILPVLTSGAATAMWNGFRRIDAA